MNADKHGWGKDNLSEAMGKERQREIKGDLPQMNTDSHR
jgi:hypothetical protein